MRFVTVQCLEANNPLCVDKLPKLALCFPGALIILGPFVTLDCFANDHTVTGHVVVADKYCAASTRTTVSGDVATLGEYRVKIGIVI